MELYAILDAGGLLAPSAVLDGLDVLMAEGVRTVQLRAKALSDRAFLELARAVVARAPAARVVINDRADLAALAGARGVHLGQDDLPPEAARRFLAPSVRVGWSCHRLAEAEAARADPAIDEIGFGPVFATRTKANPDPVVGLAGLEAAVRAAAPKPVIAIGGIDPARIAEVAATGAASVALVSALVEDGRISRARVRAAMGSLPAAGFE